jgi:AcrR family transcriptional regulator
VPRPRAELDHAAIAAAFAPDGLHGVSSADVARRAGIAKPTLYAHGRSKDAVFLACVEAEVERLLDGLYDADARTRDWPLEQRVAALALCLLDHATGRPEAFRLLSHTARHATSTVAEATDAALARIPARLAAALRRDLPADEADTAAALLHGGVVAVALAEGDSAERAHAAALVGRMIGGAVADARDDGADRGEAAVDVSIY